MAQWKSTWLETEGPGLEPHMRHKSSPCHFMTGELKIWAWPIYNKFVQYKSYWPSFSVMQVINQYWTSLSQVWEGLQILCTQIGQNYVSLECMRRSGLLALKRFSCSTPLSKKFIMLINVKMPTILFNSMITHIWEFEIKKSLYFSEF